MIAGQLLVGALSVEHYFEAVALGGGEHTPLCKYARAAVRFVLVPGDSLGQRKGVLEARVAPMRCALGALNHRLHEWAFVDALRVIAGADAVDLGCVARSLQLTRHQADD